MANQESKTETLEATAASALLDRLRRQIAILAPHQKERLTGQLLVEAAKEIEQLESACRIALWIQGKLEERGAFGAGFEEWDDIRAAIRSNSELCNAADKPKV